jgi:hypothetical protein
MQWEPTARPASAGAVGCSLPPNALALHAENRADGEGSETAKVSMICESPFGLGFGVAFDLVHALGQLFWVLRWLRMFRGWRLITN